MLKNGFLDMKRLQNIKYQKLKAFTLAEVLIVLAIIGIIASITIPTVIKNSEKQQTVVRLKKAYSTLANAINRSIAVNGFTQNWIIPSDIENNDESKAWFINTYIAPHLKVKENCANVYGHSNRNKLCTIFISESLVYGNSLLLEDGTKFSFYFWNSDITDGPNWQKSMNVRVDVNPRHAKRLERAVMGKDVFVFKYNFAVGYPHLNTMNKLVPMGDRATRENNLKYCREEKTTGGGRSQCAALIMKDGWQIKSDYPW